MTTTVSKENLKKVEGFFVSKVKSVGSKRLEATVQDIAEGSRVALATAHKALKELSERGIITIIKPSSRRFPITYVYNGDVSGFNMAQSKDEQIAYLQSLVAEREKEIKELHKEIEKFQRLAKANVMQA